MASTAQRRVYDAVVAFIRAKGYPPRATQLQRFIGDSLTTTTIWRHLQLLTEGKALVKDGQTYKPNRRVLDHYARGYMDAGQHFKGRVREAMVEHSIPEAAIQAVLACFEDQPPEEPPLPDEEAP
jgi:hypothetical protein